MRMWLIDPDPPARSMEDFNGGRIRFRLDLSTISLNFISIVKGQHQVKFYFRKSRRMAVQKHVAWRKPVKTLAQFERWDVSFCRREANTVADQLSKLDFSTFSAFKAVLPNSHQAHLEYLKDLRKVSSYGSPQDKQWLSDECSSCDARVFFGGRRSFSYAPSDEHLCTYCPFWGSIPSSPCNGLNVYVAGFVSCLVS